MTYNYYKEMTKDVLQAVSDDRQRFKSLQSFKEVLEYDRVGEFAYQVIEELMNDDSVTGNLSGSYTCSTWKAEDNLSHNFDLIIDAIRAGYLSLSDIRKGVETVDVIIRCYLLSEVVMRNIDSIVGLLLDEV